MMRQLSTSGRWVVATAAVAIFGLGVAGCSSSAGPSGGQTTGGSSTASPNLRVLLNAQPATLNPIVGARSAQVVWGTMLEPLIASDTNLDPAKTGLITDWQRTDSTTWTFTMRSGVTFSNGEKADAAAAASTLITTRDATGSILKSYFKNMADAKATNDTTLVVTTKTPQYDVPNLMSNVFIVPPTYYKEKGAEGFAAAPVGTGPYVFGSTQAGRNIVVKKNPSYWGTAALTDTITFTWSTDAAQRLALLQSKGTDVALDLPPAQATDAQGAGLTVVSTDTAIKIISFLQTDKAPFTDANLREAAALAIDRNAIVKGIFSGKATADGGLLDVKPGSTVSQVVEPNATKAKELVGGSSPAVTVTYPAAQYTNIQEVAQAVGGSLQAAGFAVTYDPVDYGTLVKRVVGKQISGLYIFAGVPNVAIPDFFVNGFMTTGSITANCVDSQIDSLASQALQQQDASAAAPIYDQLNTIGVVQKHCYVPLYRQTYNFGTLPGVKGIGYNALNAWDFSKATAG